MNSMYDHVYQWSPIWLQNVLISTYGRKLIRQRYGAHYHAMFDHYKKKDYGFIDRERALQLEETRNLIRHAVAHSRFYSDLYRGINIDLGSLDDLAKLPVVDKEQLRSNIDSVYTIPPAAGIEVFTGGTTGKSLKVVYTAEDLQKRMAYLDAFKLRCGVDPFSSTKATFSGRSFASGAFQHHQNIFWRDNTAYRQRMYSTFDLTERNMPHYLRNLREYRPEVLNGFVSALHQLGTYALDHGIELGFRPKAIFTTSETLLPHHREVIERAFGAKVYNQYASAEGATFVTECTEGQLHYNIDTGVIEVADFGHGPEMLITSFTTYGTPLIRYRIGDGIIFAEGTCNCGSSHPLVGRLEGRSVDYLYSAERGRVSLSHLADVIKGLPNCVKQMQFVQREPDAVTVRLVVDDRLYDHRANEVILAAMRHRFGSRMRVHIEQVAEIPKEASGKVALIKNLLNQAVMAKMV